MSRLVGYHIGFGASLEAENPAELNVFVDRVIQNFPEMTSQNTVQVVMDSKVKEKFGKQFSASLIDAHTQLPADEYDEDIVLLIDAPSPSRLIQ